MKKKHFLSILLILLIASGLGVVSCGGDNDSSEGTQSGNFTSTTFSWEDDEHEYDLTLTQSDSRSITGSGLYLLIVILKSGGAQMLSEGAFTAGSDESIVFTPEYGGASTFEIIITGSGSTANITIPGETVITFEDGKSINIEEEVETTGSRETTSGANVVGIWECWMNRQEFINFWDQIMPGMGNEIVRESDIRFPYLAFVADFKNNGTYIFYDYMSKKDEAQEENGRYTVSGNTVTMIPYDEDEEPSTGTLTGNRLVFTDDGLTFSFTKKN
jgi:hypothetical protein